MSCNYTFEFQKRNNEDAPAIWFQLHGRYIKIDPYALYDALWCNFERRFFSVEIEEPGFLEDKFSWFYNDDIQRNALTESATRSLTEFCNAILACKQTAHRRDWEESTAERMLAGLDALALHRKSDNKKIERFSFDFVDPFSCKTDFAIKIGDRKYEEDMYGYDTDFNQIRHDIEGALLWEHNSNGIGPEEIRLRDEDCHTTIRLDNYYLFGNPELMAKVTIVFGDCLPQVCGYCNVRQMISALYLGLLKICLAEVDIDFELINREYGGWDNMRLVIYNNLQSCVIEDYIKGEDYELFTNRPRQRFITSVEEMKADYQRLQEELKM